MNINDIAAFPRPSFYHSDAPAFADAGAVGMPLRDWFAGQALSGCLAMFADNDDMTVDERLWTAHKCAYQIADAMLKAREAGS